MSATKRDQAHRVVEALSTWLHAAPGRSVDLKETPDGWRATLEEKRAANGSTALDALAQVATVCEAENAVRAG